MSPKTTTTTTNDNDQQRVIKHLLLSSPPGQFDLILSDLNQLFSQNNNDGTVPATTTSITGAGVAGDDKQETATVTTGRESAATHLSTSSSSLLNIVSMEWIQSVRKEYEIRSGSHILQTPPPNQEEEGEESTNLKPSLVEELKQHLQAYYSSNDVISNVQIILNDKNDGEGESYTILLYAERIQLSKYYTGSWFSRYQLHTSTTSPSDGEVARMEGKVLLRAHSFENGNVQMKSTTTLPTAVLNTSSTTTSNNNTPIAQMAKEQIRSWEDQHVLKPLHQLYDVISADILKKQLRRVMPVTRMKFDWNVARSGGGGMKMALGMNQNNHGEDDD